LNFFWRIILNPDDQYRSGFLHWLDRIASIGFLSTLYVAQNDGEGPPWRCSLAFINHFSFFALLSFEASDFCYQTIFYFKMIIRPLFAAGARHFFRSFILFLMETGMLRNFPLWQINPKPQ
jgi:hypothetical protein